MIEPAHTKILHNGAHLNLETAKIEREVSNGVLLDGGRVALVVGATVDRAFELQRILAAAAEDRVLLRAKGQIAHLNLHAKHLGVQLLALGQKLPAQSFRVPHRHREETIRGVVSGGHVRGEAVEL